MSKKNAKVNKKRWAAYAAAGVAATMAGAQSAEADITLVTVGAGAGDFGAAANGLASDVYFALENGASLNFFTFGAAQQRLAIYNTAGGTQGSVAGQVLNGFPYALNAASGANISTLAFIPSGTLVAGAAGFTNSEFISTGGNLAFTFDTGGGAQFGWASVSYSGMAGDAALASFTLEEYAWGDVGEAVTVGQRPAGVIPEPTSLGLLALGAVGVMANRRRKQVA